jgi:hypothetical protein
MFLIFTKHELDMLVKALGRAVDQVEDGTWEVDELETFTVDELNTLYDKVKRLKGTEK